MPSLLRRGSPSSPTSPIVLAGVCAVCLSGCGGLFYHPDQRLYREPGSFPFGCEELSFQSGDGTRLHGWLLKARGRPAKGTVLHFHGTAQNLSSHVAFVSWLPERGFKVFGQSLGRAGAVAALGEGGTIGIRGVAIDSSFATYIGVGNELLGGTFFTYPLAWLLLSNRHSPSHSATKISPVPMLFFHGTRDPVVPISQGRGLFEAAGEPKDFVEIDSEEHTEAMRRPECRERLLAFFESCLDS